MDPRLPDSQPWLDHYDEGVPRHLSYPDISVPSLLEDASRLSPENTCLIFTDRSISYAQTNQLVNNLTAALATLGIRKGQRVGLLLPNHPAFILAYFAILKLGGIVVAINPLYTPREIIHRLNDANIELLFAYQSFYENVKAAQVHSPLKSVIIVKDDDPFNEGWTKDKDYEEVGYSLGKPIASGDMYLKNLLYASEETELPVVDLKPDDWALFQYSGGTTGEPKAAIASHRNLIANVNQFRQWLVNTEDGRETFLAAIPLYHVYGMVLAMLLAIRMRSSIVLIPNPRDLDNLLENIVRHKASIYPGVPTMYHAINQHPDVQTGIYDLHSIKACISGSAPLLSETKNRFERLTGGKLIEGYGLSEAPTATHCNPVLGENRSGSIGLPLPDVDCQIVSLEDGKTPVPGGETGELLIQGPQVMVGYYHQPDANQEILRDGWLHTGDIARMDANGYFYIIDRKKDLIKPGGMQVWPREVEEQLQVNPKVSEAGVAGIPDPYRSETVKAWVVLKPGETASVEELRAWCRTRLAAYKVPTEIEFVPSLPKSGVGKILRRELLRCHLEK